MKCVKCGIREALPGSLYCAKCEKGYYSSLDPFYHDHYTFEDFYEKELKNVHPARALAIADDELLLYSYYQKFGFFEPRLRGPISYREEYRKLEEFFIKLFYNILKERTGYKVDDLNVVKEQFKQFRDLLWNIIKQAKEREYYFGFPNINPVILFIKKILRSREINIDVNFLDKICHFFEPGSAIFVLELFSELKNYENPKVLEKFIEITNKIIDRYGKNAVFEVVNLPVVLLKPWDHQKAAFKSWIENGCKGIIEMATATGKTLLGLMAIQKLAIEMKRACDIGTVLIASHSRAILNQWRQEVVDKLGLLDTYDDYKTPVKCKHVIIEFETIQSLIRNNRRREVDLLIIDEVHHIAAPEFRRVILETKFRQFMGLSASPDEGERANIFKSLNISVVFRFGLKEAIESCVLPEFEWYLHPVQLSEDEKKEFREISEQIRKKFYQILNDKKTEEFLEKLGEKTSNLSTLQDFIRLIEKARYKKLEIPEEWRKLSILITQRRWMIHRSMPKIEKAIDIARRYYEAGKKVIVFGMDINSCNYIAEKLLESVNEVFVVHSEVKNPYDVLSEFKKARRGILVGAKMLDEGIDIPDAEIGLNVSASKTKIQLIQRLGRILRKYGDKKPIFHHFVGIPSEMNFIDFEDPYWILDEMSWVMDTAMSMGVNAKIVEHEEVKKLISISENSVRKTYSRKLLQLPSYGVIKLDKILSQFKEESLNKLIQRLEYLPENKQISNEEWAEMIRHAISSKEELVSVKGYWWILVLGNRNPVEIRKILAEYIRCK